ncbi:MAG: 5-(carboxyamino)imidazole ribonucleotide mutase [Zetaproteobacteria bacterium CG12_big_fil_rev_8_21_14_0_65_54_13]|nr:MAG: 5-(carboxyamino)imidazole ribonucleotide mutase [Zetaproteobacteria bacterium CG23_combo_of_CG06-09_8_20_14_all_54_7]PIW46760.1 MAG: 5-(carboxyamino)imidazole ribonucleotide mutase [Zetaproteobacteria bacterium CG12_big_fil_rev_8_21_14_0_65_54_13]PIX53442.1 MAG: 5-(carboxyamino)imidazole ribonucleotide mutase [Zetaproteobacteria bacterium CG_4_10_14_3_um_filter_54_28]PJA29171.1 MAG: 5-(carboxyamino)imidazole ribonucleotide mutase [Zetaproteobacteria bacterium CG_4_9_14_3_um_filter_54_145
MEALKVLILMGSKSDMPVMEKAAAVLDEFGVSYKTLVRSAHRTPEATMQAVKDAEEAGCKVFICGAGMAAHLAGVVCSKTVKPVIGVPIASGPLQGEDALHSTVMMPPGMPVATVGINAAKNAGLLAVQILAQTDAELTGKLLADRRTQAEAILAE